MVVLKEDFTYVQAFSDFLSILTIGICFVLKIPQIINLIKVKNAMGLNITGLLMELSSYTTMMSYNFRNGYALLSYLEYPIILIQELILIYFVFYYKNLLGMKFYFGSAIYFTIAYSFLSGIVPREFLTFIVPFCTPVGASSKAVQLYEILRTKNSDSVSVLTWVISVFSNLTRIFTIFVDSADFALLLNFFVNLLLSSSVMIAAYYFKTGKKVE